MTESFCALRDGQRRRPVVAMHSSSNPPTRNIQVATLQCAARCRSSGDKSSRSNWQEVSWRSAANAAGTREWERPLALNPASRFPDGCPSAPEGCGDTTKPNELVGVVDPSKGGSNLYRVEWNVGNVIDFAAPAGTARASPAMATWQSQPLGLDRPFAFPAERLDSPAAPGKSGVGTSKQKSGATGNTVDRLPPTLARVAGGEVAYAASQVLCARADRSCASLASATPRTGRADGVGRFFPSWTDDSISEGPPEGGDSRGDRPATPAVWPVQARRRWEVSFPLQRAACELEPAAAFENMLIRQLVPVAIRHQVESMIAKALPSASRVLKVLNSF